MKASIISLFDIPAYLEVLKEQVGLMNLPKTALEYYCSQWTIEKISDFSNTWLFMAAKDDSGICGIVLGTSVEGGVGTIIWMLVDRSKQQKGVGSLLFSEACEVYKKRGAHKVKLTVPEKSTVSFYMKQGMTIEGYHEKHWWGHSFWAMGKFL